MRWVILNQDKTKVHNVIVADEDFVQQHYPEAIFVTDDIVVGPGHLHQDGLFIDPVDHQSEGIIDVEEVTSTQAIEAPTE